MHDFRNRSWNTTGEICVICHTPYSANQDVLYQPLWNHATTRANFTVYSSATLDATVGQPSGSSKLFLNCHNGTVALDNFNSNTTSTNFISSAHVGNLGANLLHSHPVSFVYNGALDAKEPGLNDPPTTYTILGKTIDEDLLYNHRMECSSCHDVHKITCRRCHATHGQPDNGLLKISAPEASYA